MLLGYCRYFQMTPCLRPCFCRISQRVYASVCACMHDFLAIPRLPVQVTFVLPPPLPSLACSPLPSGIQAGCSSGRSALLKPISLRFPHTQTCSLRTWRDDVRIRAPSSHEQRSRRFTLESDVCCTDTKPLAPRRHISLPVCQGRGGDPPAAAWWQRVQAGSPS